MIALKLYGSDNARGLPAEWPREVCDGVDALPDGYDLLLVDRAAYDAYRTEHQAAYDAWSAALTPTLEPRRQETRIILDRLTSQEAAALSSARQAHAQIDMLVLKAVAEGAIRDDDPDFAAAVAALDQLGVIAAARWDELLAP